MAVEGPFVFIEDFVFIVKGNKKKIPGENGRTSKTLSIKRSRN